MKRVNEEFPEIYYDEKDNLIKGVISGVYQSIEISDTLKRKARDIIEVIKKYDHKTNSIHIKHKNGTNEMTSSLLDILKVLEKHKPDILHRFKGLGENNAEDIKTTIMDPNTRTLIRLNISDLENDMKIFQALRGNSPLDAQNRKAMMEKFVIRKDQIDT
jgi:DNA gyrase/topoisomerase IV subunit B